MRALDLSLLIAAFALAGCATQYPGGAHADTGYDFSQVTTLAIRPAPTDLPEDQQRNRALIMDEVRKQLAAKGYGFADERDADLMVIVHSGVHRRMTHAGSALSPQEGQIIIHFVQSDTGHTVWYGWVATTVTESSDAGTLIPEAVENTLSRFPNRGQDI